MTRDQLHKLFDSNPECSELAWDGLCHDCGADVVVVARLSATGFEVAGGSVYQPETLPGVSFLRCEKCVAQRKGLTQYQPCEVYARIVGYMRPLSQWNKSKRDEFGNRSVFDKAVA